MLDLLRMHLPEGTFEPAESPDGMTTIYVERERLVETCRTLRDTPELGFAVLLDVIPVDYLPREPRYEVTYLLVNLGIDGDAQRLRVRVRVPNGDARLPTVSEIWPIANWAEREAYDLFGISIDGHPDLRRILMPEDWEGFPLRKDYPVQIKAPVKTYEPLQVSAEEFAANVQAARSRSSQT
jgi:NADH-quinone oxidoreductase subunit C